jgi:hypothetical protein
MRAGEAHKPLLRGEMRVLTEQAQFFARERFDDLEGMLKAKLTYPNRAGV